MRVGIDDVATVAVLVVVGSRLVSGARQSMLADGRRAIAGIVRGIRWRHIWPAPFVLTAVAAAAGLLIRVPGLEWGWWSALGGEGNPVFGSSSSTDETVWSWLIPAVFLVLLTPALPLFALAEERMFRRGAQRWSRPRRVFKVVQFGLLHALIGVPLGAALALSIAGAAFMAMYLRAFQRDPSEERATLESARLHTVYNALIMVVVAIVIVLEATGVG